jgi:WS/DGAT/MGAT family acyltransferase
MLVRLHHVIADGVAAVALLADLFGAGEAVAPTPPSAGSPPSRRSIGASLGAVGRFLGDGLAAKTSLTGRIGDRRVFFMCRGNLERAREVAHRHGGTINDVILAVVAAGARELLSARGELRPDLELRVSVPVSRRAAGDIRVGNQVGVMIVPLPVGVADPVERLTTIAQTTAAKKRDPRSAVGWDVGSPTLQRAIVGMMRHQRFIHMLLSNVPGPTQRLRVAGADVREVFQLGVIQGNVTIAVGALSYAGQLNLDVVADADVCADAPILADGLRGELERLGVAR